MPESSSVGPTWSRATGHAVTARLRRWPTRQGLSAPLVALGTGLFVTGILFFATSQTQHLFQDTFDFDVSPGAIPRNDGGILFGTVLAGLGIGTVLLALTWGPVSRALPALAGFVVLFTFLVFSHFTIFVNGLIVPGSGVSVEASFLFHDAANSLPIATFSLTLVTALAILGTILCTARLVTPSLWQRRIAAPATLDEQRARILLVALLYLAAGAAFLQQFVSFALQADANPGGDFLATNKVAVYYLLTFVLLAVLVLGAWRTVSLIWGDLRDRPSRGFRRSLAYVSASENWLWGVILVLNAVILLTKPVFVPTNEHDRVFVMNSKGASMFFLLVFGLYVVHRALTTRYMRFLSERVGSLPVARRDRLAWLAMIVAVLWTAPVILLAGSDLSPLAKLAIRLGMVSIALPLFAVRADLERFESINLRGHEAPLVLLAAFVLSTTVGIMLWGVGNSVTTVYTASGGFVTAERTLLQPYATGIRFLGSIFMAIPLTASLALVANRSGRFPNPWTLIVAGVSLIAGMNLLLTVNAGVQIDTALRQRDVLIGFAYVSTASVFDMVLILVLWAATAGVGFAAAALLLKRGADRSMGAPVPRRGRSV